MESPTPKHCVTSGQADTCFHVRLQRPAPFFSKHVSSPTQPAAIPLNDVIMEAMLMVLSRSKDFWCACKPKTVIAKENSSPTNQVSVLTITSGVAWNLMPK